MTVAATRGLERETRTRVLVGCGGASAAEALRGSSRFLVLGRAADAASAVAGALEHEPDVCVLDLELPPSGLAAAYEIATRLPTTRILMLFEDDDEDSLFACLQAGAAGYLPVELPAKELRRAIARVAAGETVLLARHVTWLAEAFRDPGRPRRHVLTFPTLTAREWQVLDLIRQRLATPEIAERLALSPVTVRSHLQSIQRKLGAPDRAAVISLMHDAMLDRIPNRR